MFSTSIKFTLGLALLFSLGWVQSADAQAQRIPQYNQYQTAPASYEEDVDAAPAPSRMSQLQRARQRANAPVQRVVRAPSNRTMAGGSMNEGRIIGGPTSNTGRYMPRHLRTAQANGSPIVGGGAPVVGESVVDGIVDSAAPGGQMTNQGVVGTGASVGNGVLMNQTIVGDNCGGGCGNGQCGFGESYFNSCDPCAYSNGGCPPGSFEDCWLWGLGGIFKRGEMYAGATAFRSNSFVITDNVGGTTTINDASFGFYAGANYGLPLCHLTCGLLSGQIGVRSVQTEFDENNLTSDNRDQLFVTAGVYRRVDYGLQAGLVVDYMREEWFGAASLAQLRGDISWVYGPSAVGFRFTSGQETDFTSGTLNGVAFNNVFTETLNQYRFYYRANIPTGGICDAHIGWSDEDHTIFGMDADIPMTNVWALQSGFTYLLPSDDIAGQIDDVWNLYVGVSFRPRGKYFYGNYDRPLLPVADNGSMIIRRLSN